MISAYAQADDREGINAAMNGRSVAPADEEFAKLREKSTMLNLAAPSHRVGNLDLRYGKGIIRLEFIGADDPRQELSPIVVVAEIAEVLQDPRAAARSAADSIHSIGRRCDVELIESGFALSDRLHRSARLKRVIASAVGSALVATVAVWLSMRLAVGLGRRRGHHG